MPVTDAIVAKRGSQKGGEIMVCIRATDVPHQPEDSENKYKVFCVIGLLIMDCRAGGLLRSSQGAKRRASAQLLHPPAPCVYNAEKTSAP